MNNEHPAKDVVHPIYTKNCHVQRTVMYKDTYIVEHTTSTQELRKGLSPTFSSGKIKGMLNLLDGGVNQMITHLEEVTKKDRVVVNIKDVFQKMTLDVIARSFILHKIEKTKQSKSYTR